MRDSKESSRMKVWSKIKFLGLVGGAFLQFVWGTTTVYAATAPSLGAADSFSVLGATSVTNTGITTVSGDLGVSPGTSITNGGTLTIGGATHNNDSTAIQAQADVGTAHGAITGQGSDGSIGPALDSLVLTPGVYDIGAGRLNGGVLTLNGPGVYIFRASSDFVSSGSVSLINGARACDVYWDVTTLATINGSSFIGTIIAGTGVHFGNGVTLNGRALARGGDVTMIGDVITGPTCATAGSSSSGAGAGSSNNSPGLNPCIATAITTTPIILESRRISPTSIFLSWGPFAGLNMFNVRYGLTDGQWLYNTNVTGFSTTLNDLPANDPIWVQVAARNQCAIGGYGEAKLAGGPKLPNTGLSTGERSMPWLILASVSLVACFIYLALKREIFPFKQE